MKHIFLSSFLLFAALVFGCKDNSTSTVSTGMPGDIVGFVQVYDTLLQVMGDASGVKVSLPGTSISTTSDVTGRWQLSNVPPGTYKIFFSKDGFSNMEDFNITFQGNGTYYYNFGTNKQLILYQLHNFYPDIVIRPFEDNINVRDTVYYDSLGNYYYAYDTVISKFYSATFSSHTHALQNYNYYILTAMYFGKTKSIDPLDSKTFLYASNLQYNSNGYDSTSIADITILRSDLLKAGFSSGDSIYCSAFAGTSSILSAASWVDPETNKTVYSGFSPHHSEVRSFMLP
jgi:hypothetical protein